MTIPEAIGKRTATIGSAVYDGLPGPGGRVRRAFAAVHFVRGWHKADIPTRSTDVRFWGPSGRAIGDIFWHQMLHIRASEITRRLMRSE